MWLLYYDYRQRNYRAQYLEISINFEYMERNKQCAVVIAILVLAVIFSTIGWIKAQNEVMMLKNVDQSIAQYDDSLAVCDSNSSESDDVACVERLSQLSNLLSKYEAKIKSIQAEVQ